MWRLGVSQTEAGLEGPLFRMVLHACCWALVNPYLERHGACSMPESCNKASSKFSHHVVFI